MSWPNTLYDKITARQFRQAMGCVDELTDAVQNDRIPPLPDTPGNATLRVIRILLAEIKRLRRD